MNYQEIHEHGLTPTAAKRLPLDATPSDIKADVGLTCVDALYVVTMTRIKPSWLESTHIGTPADLDPADVGLAEGDLVLIRNGDVRVWKES